MSLNHPKTFALEWEGKKFSIETGRVAKQANSVIVRMEDTMVLVTVVASPDINPQPFLPLTVNYQQQNYAAGKFPGGFFKREGRPSEKEVLTSRLIDRPIRPLFPDGYQHETQVIATVISADGQNDSDIPAMIGASAALMISEIPFQGPIVGVRVGRVNGKLVLNPTVQELETSDLSAIIAVSAESVVMVEGGAKFLSEADIVAALDFAFEKSQPVIELQKRMAAELAKKKMVIAEPAQPDAALVAEFEKTIVPKLREAASVTTKHARYAAYSVVKKEAVAALGTTADGVDRVGQVKAIFDDFKTEIDRRAHV